jgi:protein SCO1/2
MNESKDFSRKVVFAALLVGAVIIGTLSFVLLSSDDMPSRELGGEDGKLGGEFTLSGTDGDVSLSDFHGKVVMIYFGFTNCKKVCPASMGIISRTLDKLEPREQEQVSAILVSVDPARDTVEAMDEYTKKYHKNIIGLTGTKPQIDEVINEYGAYYKLTDDERNNLNYAFRHSSRYYIVSKDGELVDAMRHSSTANELAARLRTLI